MARLKFANRTFHLPRNPRHRRLLGLAFIVGGVVGFLPVVGFWMIPVGLAILSVDSAVARRFRRRGEVWLARRFGRRGRGRETGN